VKKKKGQSSREVNAEESKPNATVAVEQQAISDQGKSCSRNTLLRSMV
jgi:hypothetical protein